MSIQEEFMTAGIRDLTGGGHFVRDNRMHKRAIVVKSYQRVGV
jgi:hypothetical protein